MVVDYFPRVIFRLQVMGFLLPLKYCGVTSVRYVYAKVYETFGGTEHEDGVK